MNTPLITFDVFSAMIDSRQGGGTLLQSLADQRQWPVCGDVVYADWDVRNKLAQARARRWVPLNELAANALAASYEHLALRGDARVDCRAMLASTPDWPLWPDVEATLKALGPRYRVGVLSNIDDDLLAGTRVWPLIDPAAAQTSQRLGCYKPNPRIYTIAREKFDVRLHIAASARDLRGAAEARLPVVRIERSGHNVDPDGPPPIHTIGDLRELEGDLPSLIEAADQAVRR